MTKEFVIFNVETKQFLTLHKQFANLHADNDTTAYWQSNMLGCSKFETKELAIEAIDTHCNNGYNYQIIELYRKTST